jgi:three-Cys-motif partner protein
VPPKKLPTIWSAEPHTIAKIAILEGYLQAWFPIFGRIRGRFDLLYVDGFAGPGRYTNHPTGSPVAALRSASKALAASGTAWTAGAIHCAFIEPDRERFNHLTEHVEPFKGNPRLRLHLLNTSFVDGVAALKQQMSQAFTGAWPLFVFIDPFGATGAPFETVASILGSPRSETLINFDADAIARIFMAGNSAGHERLLNDIFGDDSWRAALSGHHAFPILCRTILALYKARLRSLPNVRYVFSFEMSKSGSALEYFLIFASQHPTGLEKMKEAMKRMDQTGEYRFSDAHIGQQTLFRFDRPQAWAPKLLQHFAGQELTYAEARDFALNETPFVNPKSMLKLLEQQKSITVISRDHKRRKGTFKEDVIDLIIFESEAPDG